VPVFQFWVDLFSVAAFSRMCALLQHFHACVVQAEGSSKTLAGAEPLPEQEIN